MQINPVVLIPVTDKVNDAYAVGRRVASKLEGQYRKQAFEYEGLTVIVDVKGTRAFIVITGTTGSFVSRPRLFAINDGYENSVATGGGSLDYPLVGGNEKTSQTLSIEENDISVSFDNFLYGNIDWVGKNTAKEGEPSDAPVLTWKGPTGRLIPFDTEVNMEGLSTPDIKFSPDDPDKFTCFSKYVYQNGSIAYEFPVTTDEGTVDIEPKVLGAALTGEAETLVCVVVNHYADKTGFFEEVWINNGEWIKLNSRQVGRPTAIWAFNQSGNRATQQNLEYEIDVINVMASLITHDTGSGSYTTSTSGDTTTISHTGSYKSYSDYKGDERVVATIAVSDTNITSLSSATDFTTTDAPVYYSGEYEETTAVINGPDAYTYPGDYTITGDWGSCSTGEVTMTYPTGCGMGTITATKGNKTISKSVRMPTGVWIRTSIEYAVYSGITWNSLGQITGTCTSCNETAMGCYNSDQRDCCYSIDSPTCPENSSTNVTPTTYTDEPESYFCATPNGRHTVSSLGTCSCGAGTGVVGGRQTYMWACSGEYVYSGSTYTYIDTTFGTNRIKKITYNYVKA